MEEIKLVAFDMDNTLLNNNKKVLASSIKAIKKLKENNYKIIIASGRSPFLVKNDDLDLELIDYYVCSNGAYVMDNSDEVIFKAELNFETVEKLTFKCLEEDIGLLLNFTDGNYVYNKYDVFVEIINNWLKSNHVLIDYSLKRNHHYHANVFSGMLKHVKNIDNLKKSFLNLDFEIINEDNYDFVLKSINKVSGIKEVCKKLHLNMNNVMAFGDGNNDIAMIKEAKIGIAMENGIDDLKESADFITLSNENDGIYYALKELGFLNL